MTSLHRTTIGLMIMMISESLGIASAASGQCAHRDTTRTNLMGRTETATIWIMTSPDSVDSHWQATAAPTPIGVPQAACIRTALDVRLANMAIPPGRYQLLTARMDTTVDLILRAMPDTGDPPATQAEYRVPLTVAYGPLVRLSDIRVRTLRQGPDTVGVVDRSTQHKDVTELQLHPGTSSVLLIRLGDATLSVPIGAH
jgi:hypothetical protein